MTTLEIPAGQTVRFVNGSDKDLWPASNIHPTHQVYPDFDAKQPVPPRGSWDFTFEQPGFWRYHNHMAPADTGLVVVTGDEGDVEVPALIMAVQIPDFVELGTVPVQDSVDLFGDDALLARYVEKYGPAATLQLLSENEASLGIDCHQTAHVAGRIAYELFGALAFSLSGHECHSGGYHGATEALFRDRGTVKLHADIDVVCGEGLNDFFRHQCVHGVGHGLMAWASYEIFGALELCDRLKAEPDQRSCYSGVFMENVVGGLSGAMGHFTEYLSEDPHFPCNVLDDRHVDHCYFFQSSRMVHLFNGDFERVAAACAEAPPSAHRLCFQSMGRDVGGFSRGQDSFWDAGGAEDALAFCGLLTTEGERRPCYLKIIDRAYDIYSSPADLLGFCGSIPEGYREGCP